MTPREYAIRNEQVINARVAALDALLVERNKELLVKVVAIINKLERDKDGNVCKTCKSNRLLLNKAIGLVKKSVTKARTETRTQFEDGRRLLKIRIDEYIKLYGKES